MTAPAWAIAAWCSGARIVRVDASPPYACAQPHRFIMSCPDSHEHMAIW